jgi:hypothetical protein
MRAGSIISTGIPNSSRKPFRHYHLAFEHAAVAIQLWTLCHSSGPNPEACSPNARRASSGVPPPLRIGSQTDEAMLKAACHWVGVTFSGFISDTPFTVERRGTTARKQTNWVAISRSRALDSDCQDDLAGVFAPRFVGGPPRAALFLGRPLVHMGLLVVLALRQFLRFWSVGKCGNLPSTFTSYDLLVAL